MTVFTEAALVTQYVWILRVQLCQIRWGEPDDGLLLQLRLLRYSTAIA